MVQAGTVGRIADVHARALANGFQAFQNLDGAFAITFRGTRLIGIDGGLQRGEFVCSGFIFFGHFYFSLTLEWPKPANQRGFRKALLGVF